MPSNPSRSVAHLIFTSVVAFIALGSPLAAQNTAGSISSTVQDSQGAVIPNAKVTLVNEAQGAASARVLSTSPEGPFVFSPVLPGNYAVTVEVAGFKKYTQSHFVVDMNEKLGVSAISLEIGTAGESINVEANAVQLETLTAERSGVVTGSQVVDISINGRNYTSLLKTVAGIPADAGTGDVSANGGRTAQKQLHARRPECHRYRWKSAVRLPHQHGRHRGIQSVD
jgi:hypothetical protein